jgi:tRNA nucleotidyltransferase (CCA-adding enzyme)
MLNKLLLLSMLDLTEFSGPAYLVGGWVRDRLISRTFGKQNFPISKPLDLDFVLPSQAIETARAIAKRHQAGFVLLDQDRQIARVVFKDGTADFAQQMGNTIAEDLSRRDFTMNAIALDCTKLTTPIISQIGDLPELIDPFSGQDDIQSQQVRMISCQNLQADPLRILRAYRQVAQLGFELEPLTHKCLMEFSPLLKHIAAERVRTELSYLLALGIDGTIWLIRAAQDRILTSWIAPKNLMMARFGLVDQAIAQVINQWQELAGYFHHILSSDRSVTVIVKLAALSASATALTPLGFSRVEQRWIVTILRHLPQFMTYLAQGTESRTEQYQLFEATKEIFPALCVVAIASGQSIKAISPWLSRWLDPNDPVAHQIPILNGDDLKTELGLSAGAKIGDILNRLKLAQVEQIITDRNSAIAFAQTLI